MINWLQAAITTSLTIITAIIVYLITSKIDKNRTIKKEYIELSSKILFSLSFYSNTINNLYEIEMLENERNYSIYNEVSNELRKCAMQLYTFSNSIQKQRMRQYIEIPIKADIEKVKSDLIFLSNNLYYTKHDQLEKSLERNRSSVKTIQKILRIER